MQDDIAKHDRLGLPVVAAAFAVNMIGTTLPTPLYPLYQREFGISSPMITVIFAVYAVAVVAGLMLFGHQSDRVGRRKVLLTGLVLSALSAIAFFFARDLAIIFTGRILSGLSAGIFTGAGTAAMVDYANERQRRTYSLYSVVANVGGLGLGTLLAGVLAQYAPFPLQLVYAVDFALVAALGAAVFFGAPETVSNTRGTLNFSVQRLSVPKEVRATFISAAAAGVCAFAVSGLFGAIAPEFLGTHLGVHSPAVAGLLVFLLMGSSAGGQLLVDRLDKRIAFLAGCAMMLLGLALLAASMQMNSLALIFFSAFAAGLGQGVTMGFGLANISERITERRGEVTSAYFVLLYAGLAVPVVAVGFAAVPLGLVRAAMIFCGLGAVTIIGAAVFSRNSSI